MADAVNTERDGAISKLTPDNSTEYVFNSKYIDGWSKEELIPTGYIRATSSLDSYWLPLWKYTYSDHDIYEDRSILFLFGGMYGQETCLLKVGLQNTSGATINIVGKLEILLQGTDLDMRDLFKLYVNPTSGDCQLWVNTTAQWKVFRVSIVKKTVGGSQDVQKIGTLLTDSYTSVQTPPSDGYTTYTPTFAGWVARAEEDGNGKNIVESIGTVYVNLVAALRANMSLNLAQCMSYVPSEYRDYVYAAFNS